MHLHTSQIAGTEAELFGDPMHNGGGNFGADVIGGYVGSVGTGSTFMVTPTSPAGGVNTGGGVFGAFGGVSGLTQIIIHLAVFWILSIFVLLGLYKLGFRFSVVVGR
jgi:hypothetical protein